MFTLFVSLAILGVGALMGYGTARRFVRDRLRYVDGAHKPAIPLAVGFVTFLLAIPVANILSILPLVHLGVGAAITMGLSVGMGVSAGSKDVKGGYYELKP